MMDSLQPRDRRVLLVGAIAIGLMVAVGRGVPAWRRWNEAARSAAVDLSAQAARSDAVVSGLAESLDTLDARTARLGALKSALLAGETPADAGSNLAVIVAEAARGAAVRLDAVEVRIDTTMGTMGAKARTLPRIAVEVQATADITGLAAFLRDLEDGPALLAVRRVAVRPQNPEALSSEIEALSVRLTIEGTALVLRRRAASP
jgi:hypothetical protein